MIHIKDLSRTSIVNISLCVNTCKRIRSFDVDYILYFVTTEPLPFSKCHICFDCSHYICLLYMAINVVIMFNANKIICICIFEKLSFVICILTSIA